ncbi:LexA family transcriptional regulator [Salinarimonas sp. NSM]|uniref:LexA family transcriptional regulator n=1 Tax=Salinarimonas sp. NSM TaxID=3458003 RepID=UPI0040357117
MAAALPDDGLGWSRHGSDDCGKSNVGQDAIATIFANSSIAPEPPVARLPRMSEGNANRRAREWLKASFDRTGKKQSAFAKVLGVNPSAVTRMLSGERLITLQELAVAFRFFNEPEEGLRLLFDLSDPLRTHYDLERSLAATRQKLASDDVTRVRAEEYDREHIPTEPKDLAIAEGNGATFDIGPGTVPEIDLRAGLGGGGQALEAFLPTGPGDHMNADAVRGLWQLPAHMISRLAVPSRAIRCFAVQGDSMLPTLDEGDVVFIDVTHKHPSPPGIYALDDGFGGVIVKRLEVSTRPGEEPAMVKVTADNPRYGTKVEPLEGQRIVGRYIGLFTTRNRLD